MSNKIKQHFQNSLFIPFVTPAQLTGFIDWLNLQLSGCDPTPNNPLRHYLLSQRRMAKTEAAWRQNRDMFEHTGSDGEA